MKWKTFMHDDHSMERNSTGQLAGVTIAPAEHAVTWHLCLAVAVSSVGAAFLLVLGPPTSLQPFIALWLFAICPGFPIVRWLRVLDPLAEIGLTIVASLGITSVVAGLLLYSGFWSATAGIVATVLISITGTTLLIASGKR